MSAPDMLAVVTGASTGIGFELARQCARNGFDLLIVADESAINEAAGQLKAEGAGVQAIEANLATTVGVDKLLEAVGSRPIDALLANAGRGLGHAFVDQDFDDIRHVIDTNVTGTVYLIHKVAWQMRSLGHGRVLITGSIAGFMPGTYQAVYNGTKAFLDSFSFAIRAELKDTGVTVTCLMPGATETGFKAMMDGDGDVVTGWQNKLRAAIANVMPAALLAEQHRSMAEPGSGLKK